MIILFLDFYYDFLLLYLGSLDLDGHIVIWASSMEPKKPTNIDYINLLVLITLHLMAFGCELVRSHLYMLWVLSREERNKHTVMKILLILKVFTSRWYKILEDTHNKKEAKEYMHANSCQSEDWPLPIFLGKSKTLLESLTISAKHWDATATKSTNLSSVG